MTYLCCSALVAFGAAMTFAPLFVDMMKGGADE